MTNTTHRLSSFRTSWGFVLPWALYDFANSILIINGGLYFPQWLVLDHGLSDFWFNASLTVAALIVLVTAPFIGARSDLRTDRWRGLTWLTVGMMSSAFLLSVVTTQLPAATAVYPALTLFVAVNVFYLLSLVLYNAMLGDYVIPERVRIVSGAGLAAGWLGAIVGLAIVSPFVPEPLADLQGAGRANAFLPAAVFAAIVLVPSLLLLRRQTPPARPGRGSRRVEVDALRKQWRHLRTSSALMAFYVFYFVTSDSFGTIQQNMPIYLDRVLALPDSRKTILLGLVLICMALGGILSGLVGRRRRIGFVLATWAVASGLSLFWFATTSTWLGAITAGMTVGFTMGGTLALTRALAIMLIPADARGSHFGLYSALDRMSAMIGPLVWASIIAIPLWSIALRSRIALALLALLVVGGIFFLRKAAPQS